MGKSASAFIVTIVIIVLPIIFCACDTSSNRAPTAEETAKLKEFINSILKRKEKEEAMWNAGLSYKKAVEL